MNQATQNRQPGADPDVKPGEVAVNTQLSPRDIALQDIETQQDEARIAQIKKDVENDPGAKALADRMQKAQDDARAAGIASGELPPEDADGAASRQRMHPERPAVPDALPEPGAPAQIPTELQNDPLADHIVMDGDQPMFSLKVSGKNMLMPLDEARRRLQIDTAAEIRMQNASAKEKQIDARERKVAAGEEALTMRVRNVNLQPQANPAQPELSEADVRSGARDVLTTMFSGSEEDAADKLTKLLIDTRTPQVQPVTPVIDEAAIVSKAATAAVGAVTAVNEKKDLASGYSTFQDKYPEIMTDANLYNMADGMTDGIVTEHPDWSKSQVMLEAGKRTSEWVENLKGTSVSDPKDLTDVTTDDETISEHTQPPPTQIRQERKQELVRIPQAAIATQAPAESESAPQTPQQALDEVRRSRGQAT